MCIPGNANMKIPAFNSIDSMKGINAMNVVLVILSGRRNNITLCITVNAIKVYRNTIDIPG